MKISSNKTCKAVCYAVVGDSEKTVIAFIRGDKEVNEVKLKNILGLDIVAKDLSSTNLVAGNIGCLNLNSQDFVVVYDKSLENCTNLVTGANKEEYHYTGFNPKRDLKNVTYVDISKVEDGDICPVCGGRLAIKRGIEVGNIFQLGTKYTSTMGMTVAMPDGSNINPIMGCYGIGVGRCIAAIAEESADDKGLIWPMSIAPWHVYLCPLKLEDEMVKEMTEKLYQDFATCGIECLYDDRTNVSAGVKFADSELMGIPLRVVVSPRGLANGELEVSIRATGEKFMVKKEDILEFLNNCIKQSI